MTCTVCRGTRVVTVERGDTPESHHFQDIVCPHCPITEEPKPAKRVAVLVGSTPPFEGVLLSRTPLTVMNDAGLIREFHCACIVEYMR